MIGGQTRQIAPASRAFRALSGLPGGLRSSATTFAGVVCILLVGLLAHMGVQQTAGNVHEVLVDELYRSAQPDAADIASYSRRYGIRTIINLRDEDRGLWYETEAMAAARSGINLVNFPISSARRLPLEEANRLAEIMSAAEKPLLIHCEHGANRTGLAAAIYVRAVADIGGIYADLQLSPLYGHVPLPFIGRYNLTKSWQAFKAGT